MINKFYNNTAGKYQSTCKSVLAETAMSDLKTGFNFCGKFRLPFLSFF